MKLVALLLVLTALTLSEQAACPHATPFSGSLWSTAGFTQNTAITIPAGSNYLFDVSSWTLTNLTINGTLVFSNIDFVLNVNWIKVTPTGAFIMGSNDTGCQLNKNITIIFNGNRTTVSEIGTNPADGTALGAKGLVITNDNTTGGLLSIHGQINEPAWTRLSATAYANSSSISLDAAVSWNVGDQIVIASTDYGQVADYRLYQNYTSDQQDSVNWFFGYPPAPDQNEDRRIVSISADGKTLTLDQPLNFTHWGAGYEKAEVGLLTRYIKFQGDTVEPTQFGGHIMIRKVRLVQIEGIELTRMGQSGILGRYPVHFHWMKNQTGNGFYIKSSAVHNVFQRCVAIHDSNGILVSNVVSYRTFGHCYFLEDGPEENNTFDSNLGISTQPVIFGDPHQILLTDSQPSIFWITNPHNFFTNNVAVGGRFAYWFALPLVPIGNSAQFYVNNTDVQPRLLPLGAFTNNTAHSTSDTGIEIDQMPNPDDTVSLAAYTPREGPPYPPGGNYPLIDAVFINFLSYKNRRYGIWSRGGPTVFEGCTLVDNAFAYNNPPGPSLFQNNIMIGETDNVGYIRNVNDTRANPSPWNNLFPIKGMETYDNGGPQYVRNVICQDYVSSTARPAGCFGALTDGPFGHQTRNKYYGMTFINANRVWINDSTAMGPKLATLFDNDGSIVGDDFPFGGWILSNNTPGQIGLVDGCVPHPEWNAYSCPHFGAGYAQIFVVINDLQGYSTSGGYLAATTFNVTEINNGVRKPRATFYRLGEPTSGLDVPGSNEINTFQIKANVPVRDAYTMRWYNNTAPPSSLTVSLQSSGIGDWIVFVLPYPSSALPISIVYSQWGSYNLANATSVSTLDALVAKTYYYDTTEQNLYLWLENIADETDHDDRWGFVDYDYDGSQYIITTACTACNTDPSKTSAIPSTPSFLAALEDYYETDLVPTCDEPAFNTTGGSAYAFFDSTTKVLNLNIYHNLPTSVGSVELLDAGNGNRILKQWNTSASPVKDAFSISWASWVSLAKGQLGFKIQYTSPADHVSRFLYGLLRCGAISDCTVPDAIPTPDPCTANPSQYQMIYTDSIPGWPYWTSWSWSANQDAGIFNTTIGEVNTTSAPSPVDILCGNGSIHAEVLNGGFVLGYSAAPSRNVSNNTVDTSIYKYFEFWVRPDESTPSLSLQVYMTNYAGVTLPAATIYVDSTMISNYAIEDIGWSRVRVPLSLFNFPLVVQDIQTFTIRPQGYANPTVSSYYIDNISFTTGNDGNTPTSNGGITAADIPIFVPFASCVHSSEIVDGLDSSVGSTSGHENTESSSASGFSSWMKLL